MDKPPLHQLLETLHTQLQAAQAVTPEDTQLLQHLAEDIRGLLERAQAGEVPAQDAPAMERLSQAVRQFETSHPYLTLGLAQLLDSLSRGGL